eukprot:scaffold71110_cov61-Phaeocystis_antarctica.AAC.6
MQRTQHTTHTLVCAHTAPKHSKHAYSAPPCCGVSRRCVALPSAARRGIKKRGIYKIAQHIESCGAAQRSVSGAQPPQPPQPEQPPQPPQPPQPQQPPQPLQPQAELKP